jgi:outer membrane biosynthesis protein TonB
MKILLIIAMIVTSILPALCQEETPYGASEEFVDATSSESRFDKTKLPITQNNKTMFTLEQAKALESAKANTWENWDKATQTKMQSRFSNLMISAISTTGPKSSRRRLPCVISYRVTQNGLISCITVLKSSGQKLVDGIAVSAVKSLNKDPIFQFPKASSVKQIDQIVHLTAYVEKKE